jgi:hypothetical protein
MKDLIPTEIVGGGVLDLGSEGQIHDTRENTLIE